ncbi:MAG: hypothetical protein CM15mP103_08310 [Gammaproteobacteria bacterium]|nr:MAG: hypothetical protein CM15mP103_08310 [Gammaproteobacteria bacterium]
MVTATTMGSQPYQYKAPKMILTRDCRNLVPVLLRLPYPEGRFQNCATSRLNKSDQAIPSPGPGTRCARPQSLATAGIIVTSI